MRLIIATIAALASLIFASGATLAADGPDGAYWFRPETHVGRTHVYRLVSTGSVSVEGPQPHIVTFQLSTEASVHFGQPDAGGMIPIAIRFGQPQAQGLDASLAEALDAVEITGTLFPNGALASVYTPPVLEELGLDLGDLIIGLVVPGPQEPSASAWTIRYARTRPSTAAPRSGTLDGSFTYEGPKDWGNRLLSSVTARLRGDATQRQGAVTNQIQEIGHALYYLDPLTGATEVSSVSIVTNIRTTARPSTDVRTRITLTTTLERRRDREPPVESAPGTSQAPGGTPSGAPADTPADTLDAAASSSADAPAAMPEGVPEDVSNEPVDAPGSAAKPAESAEPTAERPVESPAERPVEQPSGEPGAEPAGESFVPPDETSPETPATAGEPETGAAGAEGAQPPAEPEASAQPEESAAAPLGPTYADPAGRFAIGLPEGWPSAPSRFSLRGTAFENAQGEAVYIYVMPLPNPDADAFGIARAALNTYRDTQPGFAVVQEPTPTSLAGEDAYEAFYRYNGDTGVAVSEWGVFARYGERAYYLQYARAGVRPRDPLPETYQLIKGSFAFGPTPEGEVAAERLASDLRRYVDEAMGFSLLVPDLWPLIDRAGDGSMTTFIEIGGKGYLTVFSRDGALGLRAHDIIAAWRDAWAEDPGFVLIQDVAEVEVAGRTGVSLEYGWRDEGDDSGWTRRLVAVVDSDTLYAVALDYETPGYAERKPTFDRILSSLAIFPRTAPASREQETPDQTDQEGAPISPPAGDSGASEAAAPQPGDRGGEQAPASSEEEARRPFSEPAGDESVLLLGRILTRYQPAGDPVFREEWVANARVFVTVGDDEYEGATDEYGYIYVSNLPRLAQGRFYELKRVEAPMFGYVQPVAITFQFLQTGQLAPRVAELGTVEVTLESDRTLSVDVRRPVGEQAASRSSLEHFIETYPGSAWVPHVQEAIAYRDRM